MKLELEPGRYVIAVSGGVDSMVLLHLLKAMPGLQLTVAHFDHGIRPDSRTDRLLVQKTTKGCGLPFVFAEGDLGKNASEDVARQARYAFLHDIRRRTGAAAVVTAHHQDDALETAILNMLRGTGRKGLSSLKSTDIVRRPLLHVPKADILRYAKEQGIIWHEDSTNQEDIYLRNYIRHRLLGRLEPKDREALHGHILAAHRTNKELEQLLDEYLEWHADSGRLERKPFIMLPHKVALEVMAAWLRMNGVRNFDKKMLERLTRAAKIHTIGRVVPIHGTMNLKVGGELLALERVER